MPRSTSPPSSHRIPSDEMTTAAMTTAGKCGTIERRASKEFPSSSIDISDAHHSSTQYYQPNGDYQLSISPFKPLPAPVPSSPSPEYFKTEENYAMAATVDGIDDNSACYSAWPPSLPLNNNHTGTFTTALHQSDPTKMLEYQPLTPHLYRQRNQHEQQQQQQSNSFWTSAEDFNDPTGLPYDSTYPSNYPIFEHETLLTPNGDNIVSNEIAVLTTIRPLSYYTHDKHLVNPLANDDNDDMNNTHRQNSYPPSAYIIEKTATPMRQRTAVLDEFDSSSPPPLGSAQVHLQAYRQKQICDQSLHTSTQSNDGYEDDAGVEVDVAVPHNAGLYISPHAPLRTLTPYHHDQDHQDQNHEQHRQRPRRESTPPDSAVSISDDFPIDKELPYAQLIYRALLTAPNHTMVLRDIYAWFKRHTDKATDKSTKGWQNSIRHNLSMNGAFKKVESHGVYGDVVGDDGDVSSSGGSGRRRPRVVETARRGFMWKLTDEAIRDGVKSTTRFRSKHPVKRGTYSSSSASHVVGQHDHRHHNRHHHQQQQQRRGSGSRGYTMRSSTVERFTGRQTSGMKGGLASSRSAAKLRHSRRLAKVAEWGQLHQRQQPTSHPNLGCTTEPDPPASSSSYCPDLFDAVAAHSPTPSSPEVFADPDPYNPPMLSSTFDMSTPMHLPIFYTAPAFENGIDQDADTSSTSPTSSPEPRTPEPAEDMEVIATYQGGPEGMIDIGMEYANLDGGAGQGAYFWGDAHDRYYEEDRL